MILAPVLGFAGAALAFMMIMARKPALAFIGSSVACLGIISTAGVSMFPFLLPSSLDPSASLTAFDATSSEKTLGIMLIAVVIFLPIVLAYTSWAYAVMRAPVTEQSIEEGDHAY